MSFYISGHAQLLVTLYPLPFWLLSTKQPFALASFGLFVFLSALLFWVYALLTVLSSSFNPLLAALSCPTLQVPLENVCATR